MNAGISDNSLSRNEVLEILESVKDGGVVDADELNDLRVLVANHKEVVLSNYVATVLDNIANGDPANQYYTGRDGLDGRTSRAELGNLYPGSSSDRLTKLISKWFLGTDSPATSTQYARLDLPLYFNGAGTEDPRQGSVGDCYLIAAMSAIADTSIGSIDGTVPSVNPGDMIVDNGDGTYGVRFYDNDGAERWVTVDKFVPGHREDNLLFAGTNSGESWAMLVEKAYVQLNESDNISQDGTNRYGIGNAFGIAGGDSGQALSHLTGQKASYGFIDSEPGNEWTADKLRALLDQDLPLVFSTGAPCALASSYNVKRRHAYTYESYDPQTQKFYLRNAWGFEHAYVTFEGLQVMGSNIAYLDGTKTKMERIDANSTFSAAFGAYGDDEESEAGLTAVESFGSVTLYTDTNNRLYAGSVAQGIKPVRINGQLATLSLNERTAIAAESIGGINQILWRDNYSQALIKMNFDSSWQFLPTDNVVMVSGTPEFNAAELAFGEGGNVDNTAPVITVISGTNTDYTNTAIATDSSNSTLYDKSLHVNGLEIVQGAEISGQAAVPDLFTEKVAQVVKLMISRSGADIDDAAQENMVRTLKGEAGTWHATKPTAQRVLRGAGADYSPNPLVDSNYSSYSGLQSFQDTHSTKDMIWYLNSDAASGNGDADITEVVEHLMHTIHSYGVRGGVSGSIEGLSWMPDMDPDWKTRELFLALKQAVDNGVFSLGGYGDEDYNTASTFELAAIEYLYLLNFNMWGYSTLWDGGSLAPEWNDNSRTPSGIETNNPLGYALYNKYIKPVLARPSLSALRNIFQDGDIGDPAQAGLSGYTPGNGIVTDTVERGSSWTDAGATADTGETVTASGTVDTNIAGTYTITYNSTDEAGNVGTATRTVTVVEPEPAQFVTLTVNQPSGGFIDYTAIHEKGATATITAIANSTNFFDGWSGDGSFAPLNADGSKAALLMDGDKTITAIFSARRSPVITSGATGMDLLENSGLGSTVYTITASSDSGGLSYAIAGADASLLSVNSASGVVSLTANPDYETKSSYSFNVTATDGLTSAPTEVTFSISNVDEVVPTITSGAIGINLAENSGPGQAVYTITAAANDGGTLLSYAIAGIDSASLSVDSQGVVSLDAVPDYETKSSYSFNVTATDAAGTSAATAVTFSIIDTTAPVITVISGTDTVELGSSWTDAGATTTEGTISATGAVDEDVAGNYTITYTASDAAGNVGTATRAVTVLPVAQTFVITVSSASSGNGNRYFVNDVEAPALQLDPGKTYVFDLSDISTGNHPLAFNPEDVGWTLDIRSVGKHLFVTVPANALGTGEYYCTAHAGMGNLIAFGDTTAPVITLVGNATPKVEAGFPYNDAGATADGGETVTASGTVNTSVVGTYTITYTATDASGNVGTATRTVIVEDTISPVITVTTGNDTVERGSSWTNAGATTTEGSISFTGSVNTDAVGTYTITYSATDSSNNTTTATRTVTVVSSGGEDSFGDVVVYPNNSTQLIGQVTIEGEVAESGDVVAIYVGNELRGKQEVITNGGVAWVNVLVNAAGGNETISFKVYDASTGVTHEKSKSSAVISTGGDVGSFASPLMIEMKDFETQTLSLKEGWNLVSFYVEADDMSPATVFAPIQGKLLQVKNLTQSYDPSVPSFLNTLSSLSVKDGYWLKVSEDVSLSVEGAVPAGASITVKSGWNLVGYPRLSGEAVAAELTSLGNTVVQIKDLGSSYDPSVPSFLNTLSTMAPGSGYWLNVNADGTWNVGTVVEISELNFAAVKTRSDHSPEEKAGPSWGEATVYPNIGATVLAKVSIQGKPVAKGGVVAAFVGNELRGLQDVVLHEGISYVTLNVNLNGEESVSYRVWNPDDNNEYLVSGSMLLELGSTYGKPELLELDAVTVVDKPFQVFNVTSEPFGFSFNTMAGRNYTVEATGDLRTWKAVELFQGSGGEIRFTAKPASTGKPQFFRVSVE
ncbi:DUF5011 domain-containing protein [Akkermansiaceae bacterium]|nr:DUF5011 domain-containing protein [Akkermansiaceae bacterium]